MKKAVSCLSAIVEHCRPSRPNIPLSAASRASVSSQLSAQRDKRRVISTTGSAMAPTGSKPEAFEYIVIGGGSGGSGAARRAAGWYGTKTLLIENGLSGGCCVNVG